MSREFRLPDIGEGLTEAEVVQWLVAVGEYVEADQPLVEVETDKAVVEIPSPYAGVVVKHGGAEGETIEVGSVLVVIGEDKESAEEAVSQSDPASSLEPAPPLQSAIEPPQASESSVAAPIVGSLSEDAEIITTETTAASPRPSSVKALPIVRKLAREAGLDLATVSGSGPGGRITRDDVEAAIAGLDSTPESGVDADSRLDIAKESPETAGNDERQTMTRLRRTIASNMSRSWSEVPHVTTFDDVDATRLLEVRAALSERHGSKIPLEALIIKAVLPAIDAFPEFNATVDGDELILRGSRDLGVAVDTPQGLMVAVVKDASRLGMIDLANEIRRLGQGAKERSLAPDELIGQTFTLSNIGAVGGGHGTPIIPPGTTAILSVGQAKLRPVVDDSELAIAPVMPLSLSYDHRVIDGAQGRRFMALLIENLEEPALFLAG